MTPSPRPADRWLPAALALGVGGWLATLRSFGLVVNDEGWVLVPALRMLEGDVLYRDVSTYYAPLRYFVVEGVFALFGPSLLAMRTVWMVAIAASSAMAYCVARRFAPPLLACLPALVYAFAPGPWHKAPYGLCSVAFLLVLARLLERPVAGRALALGAVAGLTLVTRQDLGGLQVALAAAAVVGVPLPPADRHALRVRLAGVAALASVVPVVLVLVPFALAGALEDVWQAVVVQAFGYARSPLNELRYLWTSDGLEQVREGVLAGYWLRTVLVGVALGALAWLRAAVRAPRSVHVMLGAGVLAHAAAAVGQGYAPPLLARYLQAALPIYLLGVFALGTLGEPRRRVAAVALAVATGAQLWLVNAGVAHVHPSDAYSGSRRMAAYDVPVEVLGDIVTTDRALAEDIRLVRAFVDEHVPPGEPVFTAPQHSLYYALVDRPNPTRFLAEFHFGNVAMSEQQKRAEMAALLGSRARFAFASLGWWLKPVHDGEVIHRTLLDEFHPVRLYGSLVVLERGPRPGDRALWRVAQRVVGGRPTPGDLAELRRRAAARPGEVIVWELLGRALLLRGGLEEAAQVLGHAAELDPVDRELRAWAEHARSGPSAAR